MIQGFKFVPDFTRTDADVSMLLLMNNFAFRHPVNDTVFLAQKATIIGANGTTQMTLFTPNVSVSAPGCTEQYRFCGTDVCTNPGGYYQLTSGNLIQQLMLDAAQTAAAQPILRASLEGQMNWIFYALSSEMLLTRDKVPTQNSYDPRTFSDPVAPRYIFSSPLSDNQWQLESEKIHNVAAEMLQLAPGRYAVPLNATTIVPPDTAEGRSLCGQQKIHSRSHTSFSVFGFAFTLTTGTLIIILSHAAPAIAARAQERSSRPTSLHRREEWIQNDVLQLLQVVTTGAGGSYLASKDRFVPCTFKIQGRKLNGRDTRRARGKASPTKELVFF
ncbi:hypothetical protein BCR34DRAFT_142047 [Clohesyomyces aquaticus]|uniref:Uncharacterized protein n=1 Tax=Clohesyomyces aquaticus TaxID=1231657 RepID=A0A1Y1YLQ3_9PLEO|nr:hypothetical protein BCR34DRAFT_142047 [Clohesyomyces aquaticus]